MTIPEDKYKLFLDAYKDRPSSFYLILLYRILDELIDHSITSRIESKRFANIIFNFCEDTLVNLCEKEGIFNKVLIKDYKTYASKDGSNAVLIYNLFAAFDIICLKYLDDDKFKIDFSSLWNDCQVVLSSYINNFIKNEFKGEIFFNIN